MMQFPHVIDSSMMATFKSCPRLFQLVYLENWKSKEESVHLVAGAAFAKGIEVAREAFYVEGKSAEDSIAAGLSALIAAYGDFECPADSAKSLERMCGAFEFYFDNYPLIIDKGHPVTLASGKKGIEINFAHPLPINHPETGDPLLYCGRLDALIHYANGIFMLDEKTTSSLGATWSRQWDLRSQFTGYAWGMKHLGIKVDGVIVRGVSILKTKYDTQEAISYRPEWQIDRWYEDTLEYLEDMIKFYQRGRFRHNLDHACAEYGGCGFRSICLSQDPEPFLETHFERRQWDPILRKETKL